VEKKYKDLFNNSLDAILMLSSVDGRFSDGNLASVKLFGLSGPEDLSHLNPSDLSPQYQPDGRLSKDKAKEMIDLAMGKGFNQFEWTHKKLNGQEFLALVSLSRLVNNSNLLQVIVRDITESKNKEELIREKVKESERLINFMSDRELKMVELKGELLRYKNNQNENKN
jgi:PAS domain S-box-containing protein